MSEYVDFVIETLENSGECTVRRMFGGYGIYRNKLMFALIEDDNLYMKADDVSRHEFESLDLPQFSYKSKGKIIKMSYYASPVSAMDNQEELSVWANLAYEAALRSYKKKSKK